MTDIDELEERTIVADLTGKIIAGRYRVDEVIGSGGMGVVYKVWDHRRVAHLAMKVLHPDRAEDKIFLRRFAREAETLSTLQHPHIVRFYGLEQDNGLIFMLMDYVEGISLRKLIFDAHKPFSLEKILQIMTPICSALHYAHEMGRVHCDVKPANIMVKPGGDILVADFGIARLMNGSTTTTMIGTGTPAYMAPEQVLRKNPLPQTDIYALGIVLYELLTGGERPFTGEQATINAGTPEKVCWEQVKALPPSPRKYNPAISDAMEAVVMKCLQKDPQERYVTAMDVARAIELAVGGIEETRDEKAEPIQTPGARLEAQPLSLSTPSMPAKIKGRKSTKRKYFIWAFVLLLVFSAPMALARVGVLAIPLGRLGKGNVQNVRWSPDGDRLAVISDIGLYLYDTTTWNELRFIEAPYGDSYYDTSWVFNADWSALAFEDCYVGDTELWDLNNWKLINKLDTCDHNTIFSPDGRMLAMGDDANIELWNVYGGNLLTTLEGIDGEYVEKLVFSQDGSMLTSVNMESYDNYKVYVWDMQSKQIIQTLEDRDFKDSQFSADGRVVAISNYEWAQNGSSGEIGIGSGLQLWDLQSGKPYHLIKGCGTPFAISADNLKLAVECSSGELQIWDLSSGQILHDLVVPGWDNISSIVFSPNGRQLISVDDYAARLWDVDSGQLLYTRTDAGGSIFAFHPDGGWLASFDGKYPVSVTAPDSIRIWEVKSGKVLKTIDGFIKPINRIAFHQNGRVVVSAGSDGIHFWDVERQEMYRSIQIMDGANRLVGTNEICWNGDQLLSLCGDKMTRQYSLGGDLLQEFPSTFTGGSIIFSPDCTFMAEIKTEDNAVILGDAINGKIAHTIDSYAGGVEDIAFNPDGDILAVGDQTGVIQLWDTNSGELLQTLFSVDGKQAVSPLAFSPDGKLLLAGNYLWDITTSTRVYSIGNMHDADRVVFSPSGRWIVSSGQGYSRDGGFMITNADSGHYVMQWIDLTNLGPGSQRFWSHFGEIGQVKAHRNEVTGLVFNPSGSLLASGSYDGTIRLWRIFP